MQPFRFDPTYRPPREESLYQSLADEQLAKFPLKAMGDFELVATALESLTDSGKTAEVPTSLQGHVKSLQELVDNPDCYVESPAGYKKFKETVLGQISLKIQKLRSLSEDEKQKMIYERDRDAKKARENQEKMASVKPPTAGSDSHVVSTEQALLSQQSQVFREQGVQFLRAERARLLVCQPKADEEEAHRISQRLSQIDHQLDEIQTSLDRDAREAPLLTPIAGLSQESEYALLDHITQSPQAMIYLRGLLNTTQWRAQPQTSGNAAYTGPGQVAVAHNGDNMRRAFFEQLAQRVQAGDSQEQLHALYDQHRPVFVDEVNDVFDVRQEINFPLASQPPQTVSSALPQSVSVQTSNELIQEVEIEREIEQELDNRVTFEAQGVSRLESSGNTGAEMSSLIHDSIYSFRSNLINSFVLDDSDQRSHVSEELRSYFMRRLLSDDNSRPLQSNIDS